jgi:hypothetical protein
MNKNSEAGASTKFPIQYDKKEQQNRDHEVLQI